MPRTNFVGELVFTSNGKRVRVQAGQPLILNKKGWKINSIRSNPPDIVLASKDDIETIYTSDFKKMVKNGEIKLISYSEYLKVKNKE